MGRGEKQDEVKKDDNEYGYYYVGKGKEQILIWLLALLLEGDDGMGWSETEVCTE